MPEMPVSMPGPTPAAPDPSDLTNRARPSPMSSQVGPVLPSRNAQWKMQNPPPSGVLSWWPVGLGIVLGYFAPQLRNLLAPCDPWGMGAVSPFVQLFALHEIGMSDELTRTLPQLMLYLQFPLEGLLTKFTLGRGVGVVGEAMQLFFLHFVAALVL